MKIQKMDKTIGEIYNLSQYPNFPENTNPKPYGKDALLVQCGDTIYRVPANVYYAAKYYKNK